jgi:uncharacterized protein (DUF983 family)
MSGRKNLVTPCPRCGGDAPMIRGWTSRGGYRRRKKCEACNLEYTTSESIIGGPELAEIGIPAGLIIDALEEVGIEIVRGRNFDDSR